MEESQKVRQRLAHAGELDKILQPRFVLTDKHDGVRTASHPLPIKASARIVVPGFRDRANLEGNLRKDAPTGSRLAQHFLFCVVAFHTEWALMSADVKSAFLKGDPFISRELYISGTNMCPSTLKPRLFGETNNPHDLKFRSGHEEIYQRFEWPASSKSLFERVEGPSLGGRRGGGCGGQ